MWTSASFADNCEYQFLWWSGRGEICSPPVNKHIMNSYFVPFTIFIYYTWSFLNLFQSILFLWVTQIRFGATPTNNLETIPSISCLFSSPPPPPPPQPPLLLLDTSQVWYFLALAAVLQKDFWINLKQMYHCHLKPYQYMFLDD